MRTNKEKKFKIMRHNTILFYFRIFLSKKSFQKLYKKNIHYSNFFFLNAFGCNALSRLLTGYLLLNYFYNLIKIIFMIIIIFLKM